jgi:hypothetical protein
VQLGVSRAPVPSDGLLTALEHLRIKTAYLHAHARSLFHDYSTASWYDAHTRIRGEHSPTLEGEVYWGSSKLPGSARHAPEFRRRTAAGPSIYKLVKLPSRFGPLRP